MGKKIVVFALGALLVGASLLPMAVNATSSAEENFFVQKDKVVSENYFKAGNNIDIAGTLEKDAYLAGQIINIDGVVKGDVFAAGNILRINGVVEGSVRFVGQSLIINGEVKKNVMMVGSSMTVDSAAKIGWDAMFAGNLVELNGSVGGDARLTGALARINGSVAGNVWAEVESLEFLPESKVDGRVGYTSGRDAVVEPGATIVGGLERTDLTAGKDVNTPSKYEALLGWLLWGFLSQLLIAIVLIALMPKHIDLVAEEVKNNFWRNFGWGLLFVIVTPIACILAMITVIGLPLAFVTLVIYFILLYLAKIFFVIGFMKLVFKWFKQKEWHLMLLAVIGLLALGLVCAIPNVGWIAGLIATATGFGAVLQVKKAVLMK